MHAAFILITTERGRAWEVARQVAEIEGVKIVHAVTGPYDVIAYVEGKDPIIELLMSVVKKIHAIDGVERTMTCIAVH